MEQYKALAEYGRIIKENGSQAGELVIRKYEEFFPDFRNMAYSVGIMLRAEELVREDLDNIDPANWWKQNE